MSSTHSTQERALTAREAGERIGVSPRTVKGWVRSGRLPGFDLGGAAGIRVLESDITAHLLQLRDAGVQGEAR